MNHIQEANSSLAHMYNLLRKRTRIVLQSTNALFLNRTHYNESNKVLYSANP